MFDTSICPACEAGDHDGAEACGYHGLLACACACNAQGMRGESDPEYKLRIDAAAMIHAKSRPDAPLPRYDNYPNEWALAYIEERAAEETE